MNKRLLLIGLLLSSAVTQCYHFNGKSFFSVRTPFQSGSPEREALWHYKWIDRCKDGTCNSFEIVPFGGMTQGHDLATFFSPKGKKVLNVSEFKDGLDPNDFDPNKDIEARNFNIATASSDSFFESQITLKPKHTFFGLGLVYRRCLTPCWWVEISAPIMRVTNENKVTERIINDGGGSDGLVGLDGQIHSANMLEALQGKGWKYGIIAPNKKHSKWGIADIELKLGWESYTSDCAHWRTYVGAIIPTGNKPCPRYLFSPVVGNNRHFGFMLGANNGFKLWSCDNHELRTETDVCARYLFANKQIRSFDLRDSSIKEWGRYIEVYADENAAIAAFESPFPLGADSGSFGINHLTKKVKVSPRFATTFNTALIYSYCNKWFIEGGYNFLARQGEKVELKRGENKFTSALKYTQGFGFTTKSRTINYNFIGDQQFNLAVPAYALIQPKDLDKNSAAHPPMLSQIIYGSIGYQCDDACYPTTFSIGGAYEFSHSNAGLTRLTFWGRFGMAF